jgi:hypothetical protein
VQVTNVLPGPHGININSSARIPADVPGRFEGIDSQSGEEADEKEFVSMVMQSLTHAKSLRVSTHHAEDSPPTNHFLDALPLQVSQKSPPRPLKIAPP